MLRRLRPQVLLCLPLIGLASPIAWGLSAPLQDAPPTPVRGIRAPVRTVQQREAVTGSLRAAFEAALAAREEGAVAQILAREGRFVNAGDPLVQLDTKRLEAERTGMLADVAEAEAATIQAQASSEDAQADLNSLEAAAQSNSTSVSQRELRRARTLAKASAAGFAATQQRARALAAQLQLMDIRIQDATLRAPFDGTVVERHVEVGEWVMPGTDLLTLVSTTDLEVWLDVPEGLLPKVSEFSAAFEVAVDASGSVVVATAPRAVPRVNSGTRTFPLVGSIQGASAAGLSPGMSASAWIPVGQSDARLMIPKDALVYRPAGVVVMSVAGQDEGGGVVGGVATMVPVRILFESERDVAIEISDGGLKAGSIVIVEGNERLMPGMPVTATILQAPQPPKDQAPREQNPQAGSKGDGQ